MAHRLRSSQITGVGLANLIAGDLLAGVPHTLKFAGVGLANGDRAKWVTTTGQAGDTDCAASRGTVVGSKEQEVLEARAAFTFNAPVANARLCYKFGIEPFRLYASLPHATSVVSVPSPDNSQVLFSLKFAGNLDDYPPGSAAEIAFKASVISSLALWMGVSASRIMIMGITRGSLIVEISILPVSASGSDGVATSQAVKLLESQISDINSALMTSKTAPFRDYDASVALVAALVAANSSAAVLAKSILATSPTAAADARAVERCQPAVPAVFVRQRLVPGSPGDVERRPRVHSLVREPSCRASPSVSSAPLAVCSQKL